MEKQTASEIMPIVLKDVGWRVRSILDLLVWVCMCLCGYDRMGIYAVLH